MTRNLAIADRSCSASSNNPSGWIQTVEIIAHIMTTDLCNWRGETIDNRDRINAIWWKIEVNLPKLVDINVDMNCQQNYKISRKKRLNRSENIVDSFFFWGGGNLFWLTLYIRKWIPFCCFERKQTTTTIMSSVVDKRRELFCYAHRTKIRYRVLKRAASEQRIV